MHDFYTTRMTGDKKIIVERFRSIVHEKKRPMYIRVIAAATAAVMTGAAAVASAAVNESVNGLEYFTEQEAYLTGGYEFKVNISDVSNPPQWAVETAGEDGVLTFRLEDYAVRRTDGYMSVDRKTTVSGSGGEHVLNYGDDNKIDQISSDSFANEPGCENWKCFRTLEENEGSGKTDVLYVLSLKWQQVEGVKVLFMDYDRDIISETFEDNSGAIISLYSVSLDSAVDAYDFTEFGDDYIRNSEKYSSSAVTRSDLFMPYENNYRNRKVDGIDIDVASVGEDEIKLKITDTNDTADFVRLAVFDDNMYRMAWYDKIVAEEAAADGRPEYFDAVSYDKDAGELTIHADKCRTLETLFMERAEANVKFEKGKTYRIELGFEDKDGNCVYRWMKYVTA